MLDNISSLEALTPEAMRSDAFLVPPARARLLSIYNPQAWYGAGQYFAPNPDFSAAIDYYLRAGSKDDVSVTVADARGAPVRTLRGTGRAGLNRASWDLRMEPPMPDGARETPAVGGFGGPAQGPLVLPGVYTVTVNAAGRSLKGELRVEGDPRVTFSDADRRDAADRAAESVRAAEVARGGARGRGDRGGTARRRPAAGASCRAAPTPPAGSRGCRPIWSRSSTPSPACRARSRATPGLPTADQRRQLDWAFDDATRAIDALNRVLQTDTAPSRLTVPAKLTKDQ